MSIVFPAVEELANQLFPQSPLQSPRWVSWEPLRLKVSFLTPIYCLVFVSDMTIEACCYIGTRVDS